MQPLMGFSFCILQDNCIAFSVKVKKAPKLSMGNLELCQIINMSEMSAE
jgi:hypothetical protein